MSRVAFSLRIDEKVRAALENLSEIEGRPINQLLNDAIKGYLNHRGRKEVSLEANIEALRAYRKQDQGFQRAMAAFVDAESSLEDPLEGELAEERVVDGQLEPAGPVQSRIRELLSA